MEWAILAISPGLQLVPCGDLGRRQAQGCEGAPGLSGVEGTAPFSQMTGIGPSTNRALPEKGRGGGGLLGTSRARPKAPSPGR